MTDSANNMAELHWMHGILHHVDVGLVVLDAKCNVRFWNGFMENHSGLPATKVVGNNLFQLFDDLPQKWLQRKIDSVFMLKNQAFSSWQQRPYLFKFDCYRPITGRSDWMYQDVTIFPITSLSGEVTDVCLVIDDVTTIALDEQDLQRANQELERMGRTDGLTGLLNRRAWEESLHTEYKRVQRSGRQAVLVMFDIDHFKKVNDTYGHQAGDAVIRSVAETLTRVKRETDIAGRYGGEEFGVILLDTDLSRSNRFAERLRRAVERSVVTYDEQEIRFTISLGLAEVCSESDDYTSWLEQSDQALYAAKNAGRNCYKDYDSKSMAK